MAVRTETLAASRLLDRLIRGRMWIALIAFALIGIVAMQLWLLKLNGGIGRAIEHESYLQRANAALSAENSAMSAGDLVEQHAVADGMTIVAPGTLVFLHTRGSVDERLAAARLAQPVQTPTTTTSATGSASAAVAAETPASSTALAATETPASSTAPAATETPASSKAPAATETPASSTAPAATETPAPSTAAVATETPASSTVPAATETPASPTTQPEPQG